MNRPIYIQLTDIEAWVDTYSIVKIREEFITITRYPDTIKTDPLNHKMVVMEEDGEYWYELVWEERPIIPEE